MLLLRLSLSFFTDRTQSGSGSSLGTTVFFPFVFTCNVTFSSKLFQPSLKMIIYLFTYLFSFGCAGSSLLCGTLSTCGEQRQLSSCSGKASHYGGFSCCGAWALGLVGFSSWGSWALEHRVNSCGTWA